MLCLIWHKEIRESLDELRLRLTIWAVQRSKELEAKLGRCALILQRVFHLTEEPVTVDHQLRRGKRCFGERLRRDNGDSDLFGSGNFNRQGVEKSTLCNGKLVPSGMAYDDASTIVKA